MSTEASVQNSCSNNGNAMKYNFLPKNKSGIDFSHMTPLEICDTFSNIDDEIESDDDTPDKP